MTPEGLRQVAVSHLQRFPCSVARLRAVLGRKIRRSAQAYGDDEAALLAAADEVIEALNGGPLLDDPRYAAALTESLHRSGTSRRAIRQRLRAKGLGAGDVDRALQTLDESSSDPDLAAAIRYATRRRLGPFQRDEARRVERRQRDLASLARQGFSYAIAKRVIYAEDPGDLLPAPGGPAWEPPERGSPAR